MWLHRIGHWTLWNFGDYLFSIFIQSIFNFWTVVIYFSAETTTKRIISIDYSNSREFEFPCGPVFVLSLVLFFENISFRCFWTLPSFGRLGIFLRIFFEQTSTTLSLTSFLDQTLTFECSSSTIYEDHEEHQENSNMTPKKLTLKFDYFLNFKLTLNPQVQPTYFQDKILNNNLPNLRSHVQVYSTKAQQ